MVLSSSLLEERPNEASHLRFFYLAITIDLKTTEGPVEVFVPDSLLGGELYARPLHELLAHVSVQVSVACLVVFVP